MTAQTSAAGRLFFDLSSRLKLRVAGADRVRFLNGQITNNIRKATQRASIEACVLNAKGKMEAHLFVHEGSDGFLIDADSALASVLQARLEKYVIADDVQIEDVTRKMSIFHVIGADPPKLSVPGRAISVDRFGAVGTDIWADANQRDEIASALAKEFKFCDEDCAEQLRIERGIARWGHELTPEIIPVEANLEERCIDYEKGCYIGQETISRMKMSGQRNKQLSGLMSTNGTQLVPKMRLIAGPEQKEAGWITSASHSDGIALGYVKRGFNSAGSRVEAVSEEGERVPVQVVQLPFSR